MIFLLLLLATEGLFSVNLPQRKFLRRVWVSLCSNMRVPWKERYQGIKILVVDALLPSKEVLEGVVSIQIFPRLFELVLLLKQRMLESGDPL